MRGRTGKKGGISTYIEMTGILTVCNFDKWLILYYRCECDKCPPELCPSGLRVQVLEEGSGTPGQCCSKYRCVNGRSGTIEPSRCIHCIASQFFCQNACLPTCIICTSCTHSSYEELQHQHQLACLLGKTVPANKHCSFFDRPTQFWNM